MSNMTITLQDESRKSKKTMREESIRAFLRDPSDARICDLITRSVPFLMHGRPTIPVQEVLEQINARKKVLDQGMRMIATGRYPGLGHFNHEWETKPHNVTNYAELMSMVAKNFPRYGFHRMKQSIEIRDNLDKDQRSNLWQRIGHAYTLMSKSLSEDLIDDNINRAIRNAETFAIDINIQLRKDPDKEGTPIMTLYRQKSLESTIEKIARKIVGQTNGTIAKNLLRQLNQPPTYKFTRGYDTINMILNMGVNDNGGVKNVYLTQGQVHAALSRILQAERSGELELLPEPKDPTGQKPLIKNYINKPKHDRPYQAVHFFAVNPAGGPDAIEIQLMTLDAFLLEIFDPETNHLVYDIRSLGLATTEKTTLIDGTQIKEKPWVRTQDRLYDKLHPLIRSVYGLEDTA